MSELITHLPGQDLPVSAVGKRLRQMWDTEEEESPSEFRASQMNIVLHFGLQVKPEEAMEAFNTLVRFVQRYPGRIIVLCPTESRMNGSMGAKLFSQCYIGSSQREMCCCEALMLSFEPEDFGHLANQVSVWLEPDLPTYHGFIGVPMVRLKKYFNNLLRDVQRTVHDSSIESPEVAELDALRPGRVRDLAQARLLPVRQSLGQFLSGFPMASLLEGLKGITVGCAPDRTGEANRLCEWLHTCLEAGSENKAQPSVQIAKQALDAEKLQLNMIWEYEEGRHLNWELYREAERARFDYKLGAEGKSFMTQLKSLAPEQALAEAFFF
ncbi:MAG: hypothetical protein GWO81_05545 [Verrucomicrobia bacterium]|nr:hypothetical protein [Verrucomicrobiota bacterium]